MHIHRDDRKWRLAMTMADNAIQGPGSTRFEEEEAEVDKRPVRHVGVCQFHRLDSAGNSTDKHFPETELFDRLLRLIRKSFGFGMGAHILRAVAGRFEALTKELEQNARELASTATCSRRTHICGAKSRGASEGRGGRADVSLSVSVAKEWITRG